MKTKDQSEKQPIKPKANPQPAIPMPEEIGGSGKAEPTRYGDWEVGGRCTDF